MALQSTTALATVTLQAATPTVTFSGIPNTYRDLVVMCDVTGLSAGGSWQLRLNEDTGNNYNTVMMRGIPTTTFQSFSFSNESVGYINVAAFNNDKAVAVVQVIDYSATNKHKSVLSRSNYTGTVVEAGAIRWANTAAVTSLTIRVPSGNFASGSTFSLYGRIA